MNCAAVILSKLSPRVIVPAHDNHQEIKHPYKQPISLFFKENTFKKKKTKNKYKKQKTTEILLVIRHTCMC